VSDEPTRQQEAAAQRHRRQEHAQSLPQTVFDLYELLLAYLKQETALPLQQLVRVLALGVVGALLYGLGGMFVTVGLLRVLQEETTLPDWSQYLIVLVVLLAAGALIWKLGTRRKQSREVAA
jgi:hypothetical protein